MSLLSRSYIIPKSKLRSKKVKVKKKKKKKEPLTAAKKKRTIIGNVFPN